MSIELQNSRTRRKKKLIYNPICREFSDYPEVLCAKRRIGNQ